MQISSLKKSIVFLCIVIFFAIDEVDFIDIFELVMHAFDTLVDLVAIVSERIDGAVEFTPFLTEDPKIFFQLFQLINDFSCMFAALIIDDDCLEGRNQRNQGCR